ncbi:hypothetical protein [Amycolatopsis sp. NPDC054798]
MTDIEVWCRANPYDSGRRRLWAAPAAAAWLVEAAAVGVDAEPLPDDLPDLDRYAGLVQVDGRRYLLAVSLDDSTEMTVRAVSEDEVFRSIRARQHGLDTRRFGDEPPF